jgi:pimeloyl-ACP methyl ester carboxylesterase
MLENGIISTSPIWAERGDWLSSYVHHIDTLAEYFRVIVPDFRGSGRTVHPGGPISYDLLADRMRRAEDAREHRGTREKTMRGVDTGVKIAALSPIAPDPSPPQGQDDNNDDHDDNDRPDADIHG